SSSFCLSTDASRAPGRRRRHAWHSRIVGPPNRYTAAFEQLFHGLSDRNTILSRACSFIFTLTIQAAVPLLAQHTVFCFGLLLLKIHPLTIFTLYSKPLRSLEPRFWG